MAAVEPQPKTSNNSMPAGTYYAAFQVDASKHDGECNSTSPGIHIVNAKGLSSYILQFGPEITEVKIPSNAVIGSYKDKANNTVYVTETFTIFRKHKFTTDVAHSLIVDGLEPTFDTVEKCIRACTKYSVSQEEITNIMKEFLDYIIKHKNYGKIDDNINNFIIDKIKNGNH
jgi:hypothetical protein